MKKLIYLIVFMLTMGGISTFAQTDSVKVRVKTSNGAEISLDGDVSSTNNIYKLVPIGKHIVEVKYGFSYTRTYEIDVVKGGPTDFEFMLEGKLVLNSTPSKANVYVDGLLQGKSPVELPILGRHNIKVVDGANMYHPYNETLEFLPEQVMEKSVILKKRPPRLYGFVLANYMISAKAPGLMMGIGRRFGAYTKFNIGVNGLPNENEFKTYNQSISSDKYKKQPKYYGANAGLMVHIIPCLFAYVGSGYGKYSHGIYEMYDDVEYDVYHVKGAEIDFGAMFKYKALLLQAGYKRILSKGQGGNFGDFNVGIGITIHKEKNK